MSEENLATVDSAVETPEPPQMATDPEDGGDGGETSAEAAPATPAQAVGDGKGTAAAEPQSAPEPAAEPAEAAKEEKVAADGQVAAEGQTDEGGTVAEAAEGSTAEPRESAKETSARPAPVAAAVAESDEVTRLRQAMEADAPVLGKVIGWNNGGFHVVVDGLTAFCPRSEIEVDAPKSPKTYLDQELEFRVIKIQRAGKRIVLSRSAHLRNERRVARDKVTQELTPGGTRHGRVASITDFGAFVDLDGVQGLVHISELSLRRVEHPSEVVEVGQEVEVKILRVESGGKRISLSMKALQPDPWDGIESKLEEGSVVTGTVERTAEFGAFISVAPGLTGLLPTSVMGLPRGASAARMYSPGKEVPVQIQSIDRRRRRISLSLEGSTTEGSRKDFESYRKAQDGGEGGFNALAAALEKIRRDDS